MFGEDGEPDVAKAFVIDMELSDQLGTDPGEGTLAALQSPHIISIALSGGDDSTSVSAAAGSTITGSIIKGINIHTGFSMSIFDPITLSTSDISLSNIKLLNSVKTTAFLADNTGQSNSTRTNICCNINRHCTFGTAGGDGFADSRSKNSQFV